MAFRRRSAPAGRTAPGRTPACIIRTERVDAMWGTDLTSVLTRRCNETWIVERHGHPTPAAVRAVQLAPLAAAA